MPEKRDDLLPQLAGDVAGSLLPIPGVGTLTTRGWRVIQAEWASATSRALRLAEKHAHMSREDVAERLEANPELVPLLVRVLYAAGMSGQDQTLRLLAGYLGGALANPSSIDDVSLMLSAVEDLSEHHIKILEILDVPVRENEELRDLDLGSRWTTGLVTMASEWREEITQVAIRGLVNAGFVGEYGLDGGDVTGETGGTILGVTEMGRSVLQVLRTVGDD